jgi:hypothetical protein
LFAEALNQQRLLHLPIFILAAAFVAGLVGHIPLYPFSAD